MRRETFASVYGGVTGPRFYAVSLNNKETMQNILKQWFLDTRQQARQERRQCLGEKWALWLSQLTDWRSQGKEGQPKGSPTSSLTKETSGECKETKESRIPRTLEECTAHLPENCGAFLSLQQSPVELCVWDHQGCWKIRDGLGVLGFLWWN